MGNKKLIILFAIGLFSIFLGYTIKLSGNQNAVITITFGLLLQGFSVLGLLLNNLGKIKRFFN